MTSRIRTSGIVLALLSTVLCMPPAWAFDLEQFTRTTVAEYVNDQTGHYYVATADEQPVLDSGTSITGWHRTGFAFRVYLTSTAAGQPVCRFYAPGPVTNFYTASAAECSALQAHPEFGWIYEGIKFRAAVPVDGSCPELDSQPVHRLYNNRPQFNDSNHRYVTDDGVRADMVARGWTDEGVVMCAQFALHDPVKYFAVLPSADVIRPIADCENEDITQGSCIGMNGLPAALTTRVAGCVTYATNCGAIAPFWTPAFDFLTGTDGSALFTAQPAYATQAILEHSYVQPISYNLGAHVSSADAFGALASIEPLYQFTARAPAAGAADARVFPWRLARDNHVEISFWALPKTVRRANAQSHGYGAPVIEFRDVASGASIDVSMLTYGTIPPGDFVGAIDARTGNVYVSTTMGTRTLFGTTRMGNFIPCAGDGACASASTFFNFRITAADFAKVLSLARGSNPALSANPADYALANFRFRNGILGTADVGVTIAQLSLGIYGY
jgi:hypothetical protein